MTGVSNLALSGLGQGEHDDTRNLSNHPHKYIDINLHGDYCDGIHCDQLSQSGLLIDSSSLNCCDVAAIYSPPARSRLPVGSRSDTSLLIERPP